MKLDNIMNGKSYFGGPLDPEISSLLEDAANHFSDTGKALSSLLEAREKAPYALAVFFSLYKFYFYKNQLDLAEKTVRESLFEAAYQGGFPVEPALVETTGNPCFLDPSSPHYFYLFSSKALSFILLRQGRIDEAQSLLSELSRLDPSDRVGSSVIRDYLKGATKGASLDSVH